MKKQILKSALIAVAGVGLMAGSASAMLIDFTSSAWFAANGQESYSQTINGINVTASAPKDYQKLYVNKFDGGGISGLANQTDGLGINTTLPSSEENDEISSTLLWGKELLTISFNPDAIVNYIYIYDIDDNDYARYQLENGSWINTVAGLEPSFTITTGSDAYVSWVKFESNSNCVDFAVAGMDVTPVPEPTTMLLFGAGLIGLTGIARRRQSK